MEHGRRGGGECPQTWYRRDPTPSTVNVHAGQLEANPNSAEGFSLRKEYKLASNSKDAVFLGCLIWFTTN